MRAEEFREIIANQIEEDRIKNIIDRADGKAIFYNVVKTMFKKIIEGALRADKNGRVCFWIDDFYYKMDKTGLFKPDVGYGVIVSKHVFHPIRIYNFGINYPNVKTIQLEIDFSEGLNEKTNV